MVGIFDNQTLQKFFGRLRVILEGLMVKMEVTFDNVADDLEL